MAPPAQQAEQVELSPYSKLEKTILRRATSVEINGQHCNLSGTSTSTTRHKQSRVIKYHLLDNPFLAVPVNHQDKGQRQAKPKAPDPGGAEETEGTQKIQRQNPSSAPPEFHSTFQSFQTSSAPRPLWSSLTMPQNNGEGPVGSPRERSMFQVLEDARGLTGAEEGRVDIVPETPTQQGRATFRGPAAGWRSGTIHVGPAASPGSHDPFYNTPAPQTYGLGLNFGGTPNMFSPPGTAFGNPIPTPYNQNTFQWPNTPAPSRAMTSNNWRSPAPAPTSQEVQLHTPAPSLTHYSSYLGSQYYTLQVQGTLMSMYQPRPVNQTVTLYNPVASLVNTGLYQPRRGRSPEAYRTHNHINYYGYVPSSLHRNSDPTLADVRRAFRLHPRYHTIPQEKARAEKNHPTVITESEIDDEKTYGKWNGGYVEISDDLIARCICPADLLQHPCPWDELGDGCQMVRLCYEVEKHTHYVCPDAPMRTPDTDTNIKELSECPHLHWEVDTHCRYLISGKRCQIVMDKNYDCACGHDFEYARKVSRCRFEDHILQALYAGATRFVKRHCILLNHPIKEHRYHIKMADGPEARLPRVKVYQAN